MFVDLEKNPVTEPIEADLCIIGSGAAGLTIATEFLNSSTRVVVLEGGGWTYSEESQDVYRGKTVGQKVEPGIEAMRLRFLGGTTNHWTGLCRPLDESDFQKRDWVPNSGWPISKSDLDPFIPRTHTVLDLGTVDYDIQHLAGGSRTYFDLNPELFTHDVWRVSPPTRFGTKYKSVLEASSNVKVYLNANVTEVVLEPNGGSVKHIAIKDPAKHANTVRAKAYVVACGGIENARVLLASRSVKAAGIGNEHDLVGRHFHEHPHVYSGTLRLFDEAKAVQAATAYTEFKTSENDVLPAVAIDWSTQQKEQTLNNAFCLQLNTNLQASPGYLALRRLFGADDRSGHKDFWEDLKLVAGDLGGTFAGVYGKLRAVSSTVVEFKMLTRTEQAPNPNSRVRLNDEVDEYGVPRVTLDWELTPLDKHTIRTANTLFGQEIGRLGLGRVELEPWLLTDDLNFGPEFHAAGHHMGTTRMAATAETGVVNPDCRVFGTDNLYVAGSSSFPTGGYANPTFTIVQLALRLADHLKAGLKKA